MGKKKQPDFQPVKLRVGKHLPKGRNVTDTSFKSKKIITRDQNIKTDPKNVALGELLRLLKHNNVSTKIDALKRIKNFIERNIYTFPVYFADIINELGRVLLQDNIKVRREAVDLFTYCLDSLSESQMYCFISPLASYLDCMMTHVNSSVKKESLILLQGILNTHPNLICCYTKILFNLLNMISCQNYQQKEDKGQTKRKLIDTINDDVTSVELRDRVLKLVVEFLGKLIENFSKSETNEDEQKVYWDGNQPLYIPLYAGSGLTPAKLEFYCIGRMKSESKISADLNSFLRELIPLSSNVITEEIASTIVSTNCNILRADNVRRLSTIIQVLCQIGDWLTLNSDIECKEDPDFLSLMNNIVCKKLMLRFPYTQQCYPTKRTGKSTEEEVHLNLGICYLYNTFILGTNYSKEDMEKRAMQYLCHSCTATKFADIKSVSLVLKNIKRFIEFSTTNKGLEVRTAYESEISSILACLCGNIIKFKNTTTAKLAESFFIKLSLDHEYKFLLSYDGMNEWIKYLFVELKHMFLVKKADKKLLKCINQICCREYPAFFRNLSTLASSEILEYMKFDDEDYQFTIMNFITHMTNLPGDFLQDVAELILCDNSLSTKTIVKFIRLLHHRFSDPNVRELDNLTFLKFLINVALDVKALEAEAEDREKNTPIIIQDIRTAEEMEQATSALHSEESHNIATNQSMPDLSFIRCLLKNIQFVCLTPVMPSVLWERHSVIFEVCVECLLNCSRLDFVCRCVKAFVQSLMQNPNLQIPVHSAIAFFRLVKILTPHDGAYMDTDDIVLFSYELFLSSLLYISLMTDKVPNNLLKPYGIGPLQNSLNLAPDNIINVFNTLTSKIYEQGLDELKCLHVVRVVKFFILKKCAYAKDVYNFIAILQAMEVSYCPDGSRQRSVVNQIYDILDTERPLLKLSD